MKTKHINYWYNRPNLASQRCRNIHDTINLRGWIERNHNEKCNIRPPWYNNDMLYVAYIDSCKRLSK